MSDYSKKTNAELVEILKARSLPHTGKKVDLVARLQDNDSKTTAAAPANPPKTDTADDVIDWDEEPTAESNPATTTAADATAADAGGTGAVANPVAVPNQQLDTNPAATDDLKVESTGELGATGQPEAATAAEEKPAMDFTRGLPASELEEELRKRKARAEKFGIVEDEETALKQAEKQLERAKRFGTGGATESKDNVGVKGLDEALPDERSRKRSRNDQGGRGGKRRDAGRNRNRQRDNGPGRAQGGGGGAQGGNVGQKNWSEKDASAMEARKKRFATAA